MLLVLTRWLFVASLLSSFGAALFLRVVPSSVAASIERRCRRVAGLSIAVALIAGLAWLLVEAGAMAETATLAETLGALPAVLLGTWFGTVLLAQGIALVGAGTALALFPRRSALPAGLAAAATLLEAGHSHAFAMSDAPSLLLLRKRCISWRQAHGLAGSCLCSSWCGRRRSMRLNRRRGASRRSGRFAWRCSSSPRSIKARCWRAASPV